MRRRCSCAPPACWSRCWSLSPPLALGRRLEPGEGLLPEAVEVRAEVGDRLRLDAVDPPRSVLALGHEPRLLQDAQVLRDCRAGDGEARGDLAHRARAAA